MKSKSAVAFAIFALTAFGAAAQQKNPPLSVNDRVFLTEIVRKGVVAEEIGRLAQVSSPQPTFVNVGKIFARDPSHIQRDLRTVSKRYGLKLPAKLDPDDRAALAGLLALEGGAFDELCKTAMFENAQKRLDLAREAASSADAADVRAAARRAIPVLESQLLMTRNLVPNRSVLYGMASR